MDNVAGSLGIKITADATGVKRGLKETSRNLNKVERQLNHNQRSWKSWSIQSVAATVAIGMAVGAASRKVVEYGDAFQNLTNKLKITTNSQAELTEITSQMFDIASRNRSSIEGTVDLYTKLHRSTKELGLSMTELTDVTDTIQKSFIIGGASTVEMDGAVRQLGQALASGVLRGQEFNSVAEQAPVIMEAVKEATGKNAAELRKLAAEGAITAEILVKSLQLYRDKAIDAFGKTEATFAQNMVNARNELIKFVGANESLKGILKSVGEGALSLAKNMDTVIEVTKALAVVYSGVLLNSLTKTMMASEASILVTGKKIASMRVEAAAAASAAIANANKAKSDLNLAIHTENATRSAAKKVIGTAAETAAMKKASLATAERIALERAYLASLAASGVAQGANIAITNTSAAALTRQNAALAIRNFLTGNWVTLAAVAGYGAYQWATSEGELEKNTRMTNDHIRARIGLMDKVSEKDLATQVKVLADAEARYTADSIANQKALEKAKEQASGRRSSGSREAKQKIVDLQQKEIEIAQNLNRVTQLRIAGEEKLAKKKQQSADESKKQAELAYLLEESSARETLDAWNKKSQSKIDLAKQEEKVVLDALAKVANAEKKRAEEDLNSGKGKIKTKEELSAKMNEIEANYNAERERIIAESQTRIDAIKENSKEGQEKRNAQQAIDDLRDRFKTEEQLEIDRYTKQVENFKTHSELLGMAQSERDVMLENMAQLHKDNMDAINGGDSDGAVFLENLKNRFASEQELLQEKYDQEIQALALILQNKQDATAADYDLLRQLAEQFESDRTAIEKSESEKRKQIAQQEMMQKINNAQLGANALISLGEAFGSKSDKQQKKWRRLQIVADTAAGVMKAFATSSNVYEAFANSALVVAQGKKSLDALKNNAAPSGSARPSAVPRQSSQTQEQATPQRNINISLTGGSLFSADQVRALIGEINNQIGDGVVLNTGG